MIESSAVVRPPLGGSYSAVSQAPAVPANVSGSQLAGLPSFDASRAAHALNPGLNAAVAGLQQALAPTAAAQAPDPTRPDHAVYSVQILGFSSEKDGDTFGKGEWFVARERFARTPIIKGGDGDWVDVKDPRPFVLPHDSLDASGGKITVDFELYDQDTLSDQLLGTFKQSVHVGENGIPQELTFTSKEGGATVKIRLVRNTVSRDEVSDAFIAARGGNWKRIAADFSAQRELLFRAERRVAQMSNLSGTHYANDYLDAMNQVSRLQDAAFRVRASVKSIDPDMKEFEGLKDRYNERMMRLSRSTVVIENEEPRRPPNPPIPRPPRGSHEIIQGRRFHYPFNPVYPFLIR